MSLLLCFSGQIASGKSSVSTAVAEALGWRRTGFGDYLRSEIERRGGDPESREALQDLGQSLVDSDPMAFCRNVLEAGGFQPGDDFVVDGIRHVDIFEVLQNVCSPTCAKLIFLGADERTRKTRVGTRSDKQDFERASGHPVELELSQALPQRADGLIKADQPFDVVVADCLSLVQSWL